MGLETILTGIGAILTAAGGTYLLVHEFRRRDRRESQKEIESLEEDLHHVRQDNIVLRRILHEHGWMEE